MTNLQNISLGRKEDWDKVVHAAPRTQPERVTARKLKNLSPTAKNKYDRVRRDWHANMGVLRTPQLLSLLENLQDVTDSNVHDGDRTKGAVAVEGAADLARARRWSSSRRSSTSGRSRNSVLTPMAATNGGRSVA